METLKLGSKGEDVKVLQSFLKITVDGDFGPKTEAAVKSWQSNYGLVADGVVGPKTQAAMGFLDTDIADTPDGLSERLVIEKSYLPKGQYFEGPTPKQWLFIHHTAGWQDPYGTIAAWGRDTRGEVATPAGATRATQTNIGATSIYTFDQPIIMETGQIMAVCQSAYAGAQDQFEKVCKFLEISNCTVSRRGQLLSLTDVRQKGTNLGIRYYNQSPNGVSKNGSLTQPSMTFDTAGLLPDPNCVKLN